MSPWAPPRFGLLPALALLAAGLFIPRRYEQPNPRPPVESRGFDLHVAPNRVIHVDPDDELIQVTLVPARLAPIPPSLHLLPKRSAVLRPPRTEDSVRLELCLSVCPPIGF